MNIGTFAELSTPELLDRAAVLAQIDTDSDAEAEPYWAAVFALRGRPEAAVFQRAVEWCASAAACERALGADILAQLGAQVGVPTPPFVTESTPILVGLLDDTDEDVLVQALYALAHLRAGPASALAPFSRHKSARVRMGATYALGGRDEPVALEALCLLSTDADIEIRDWATFGLGSLSECDTPEIREALVARLDDEDNETRCEAIVGLARRVDARVTAALTRALQDDDVSLLAIEAAALMPAAQFIAPLERVWEYAPDDDVREALERCRAAAAV